MNGYVESEKDITFMNQPVLEDINLVSTFYQYPHSCFPVHRMKFYPIVDNHLSSAEIEEHFNNTSAVQVLCCSVEVFSYTSEMKQLPVSAPSFPSLKNKTWCYLGEDDTGRERLISIHG